MNNDNADAKPPAGGHKRTGNAVGCKPTWCMNICYALIGYLFMGPIIYASAFPSFIGMWDLGPKIISKVISSLGPPLMTLEYQDKMPENRVSFPPGVKAPDFSGSGSKKAFDPDSLTPTQKKTFKSAFDQLDDKKLGYITTAQFSKYISGDKSLKTEADKKAFIAKVDGSSDGKISYAEFAKWMASESS